MKGRTGIESRRALLLRVALALGLVGLSPESAHAGNLDSFYVSGEATLLGGAILSSSTGGGSIWYNPAGLSHLSGARLDVNVSGYAVRFGATANFDSAIVGATENRLSLLNFDVVPAAVTLTRRFGKFGVGIGVFVPSQSEVVLRTELSAPPDAGGTSLDFGYDSNSRFQEYHVGPGIGWDPVETLSLGASLLGNYRTQHDAVDVTATVETPTGRDSFSRHNTFDSIGVGLEMILGAQWELRPNWVLGAVVRTPALRLGQAADVVSTSLEASSDGTIVHDISFDESISIGTAILSPFRFHLGLSHSFGKYLASGEASLMLPFVSNVTDLEQRLTWNARAGLRRSLSDHWTIGGGIYSDRSPAKDPVQFQDKQIDYYGLTVAVDWAKKYGIIEKEGEKFAEPQPLIFGTTVALSYAFGIGELASGQVGPDPAGGIVITPLSTEVTAHEFTLHISSTISE